MKHHSISWSDFEAFLENHDALDRFYKNIAAPNKMCYIKGLQSLSPSNWLFSAFAWKRDDVDFWKSLNAYWLKYCN